MRRSFPRSRLAAATAGASLVLAGAVGGIAVSAPKGDDGTIHACFSQSDLDTEGSGQVFLVNAGTACPAQFPQALGWNAVGVQGPKGDPGTKGEGGIKGDAGEKGPVGDKGATKPLLTKPQQDAILKQQKADEAKAKRIGTDLDRLRDQLDNLQNSDQLDMIRLASLMSKYAQATDQLTTIMRRLSENQRELVKNAQ